MTLHETHIPPERGHDDECDCTLCRMMTQAEARSLAEEINATAGFEVTHALWYGFGNPINQRRAFTLSVQYCSAIPDKVNVTQSFEVIDEAHWHEVREMAIQRGPVIAYDDPHPELRLSADDLTRMNARAEEDAARMETKRQAVLVAVELSDDD